MKLAQRIGLGLAGLTKAFTEGMPQKKVRLDTSKQGEIARAIARQDRAKERLIRRDELLARAEAKRARKAARRSHHGADHE